jgi:copper chaperone CopZ
LAAWVRQRTDRSACEAHATDAVRRTAAAASIRRIQLRGALRRPIQPVERSISMRTEVLKVTGMTRPNCITEVTDALQKISGVSESSVSLSKQEVTVKFDDGLTSPAQLRRAVRQAGYGVVGNEPQPQPHVRAAAPGESFAPGGQAH